ncbi:uncharacterized protein PHALS_13125 [Plasmopara halstedii]|uniref:Uncharacterized protein n=1 Tax=Plasmopara halstedii TaxID=4781 RepID=A0A0P1APC6_PLAHL|nr:uncharacterized protein PHALS_13125 [Plasmopara halstedii]CEG42888.1 hypothetical protein PHALS_13125 [Plasmopara halstedii]|eukprot:XP_024579257.1 hypothetical protein PHALS_13125 [Plasmopara halstedii]
MYSITVREVLVKNRYMRSFLSRIRSHYYHSIYIFSAMINLSEIRIQLVTFHILMYQTNVIETNKLPRRSVSDLMQRIVPTARQRQSRCN